MKVTDFHQQNLKEFKNNNKYANNKDTTNNNKINDYSTTNNIINLDKNLRHIGIEKEVNIDKNMSETQEKQIIRLLKNENISEDFNKCFFLYLDELDLSLKDIIYINVDLIDNEKSNEKENKINTIYRTNILLNMEKSNSLIINILTRLFISKIYDILDIALFFEDEICLALATQMGYIQDYFDYNKKTLSIYLSMFVRDNSLIIDECLIHFEIFVFNYCLKNSPKVNVSCDLTKDQIYENKFLIHNDLIYILDILYFMDKKSSIFLYLEVEFRRMNSDFILVELNNLKDNTEKYIRSDSNLIEDCSYNSKSKKNKTSRSYSSNNFKDMKFNSSKMNNTSNSIISQNSYTNSGINKSKSQKNVIRKNSNGTMLSNVRSKILDHEIELKQVTIIKDLFLHFPFLPSKISITKITSILIKYSNSNYQCSFFLGVTKKIFKEDSLILQKSAIFSIYCIYNFFNDYIMNSIRLNTMFDIFIYDSLLQNIDEILSRIIHLENDNKYFLIQILGELVGIFYGLDCQDNLNSEENKKNVSVSIPESSINTTNILDFKEEKSEIKVQIKDGLNLFNKLLTNRKKSLRLSLINTNLKNISMGSYDKTKINENALINVNVSNKEVKEENIQKTSKLEFTISSDDNDNSNTKRSNEDPKLLNEPKFILQKKEVSIDVNNAIKEIDEDDERLDTNGKETNVINKSNKVVVENANKINDSNIDINPTKFNNFDSLNKSIETKYSIEDFLNLYKILFNENNWRFRLKLASNFPIVIKRVLLYGVIRMENKKKYYKELTSNNNEFKTNTRTIDGDAKIDIILEYKRFRNILLDLIEHFNLLLTDKVINVKIQAFESLIPTLESFSDCFNYNDSIEYDDNSYKLNNVIVWRLASTFNYIILNGESCVELKVALGKCIKIILTVIDFFDLIDRISLVIDYLINDNNLLVKMEISKVMYDVFKIKILYENSITLKNYSFKESFFNRDIESEFSEYIKLKLVLPHKPVYKRDLEHFSILKRFLLDKDYRIRRNSIKMCFNFYLDFGLESFVNNFLDFFNEGFEDICSDVREYTGECLIKIIEYDDSESNTFIILINTIITKINKYFDNSNKIKYQTIISLIKVMFKMMDCKHVYKYVKEHFFKHILKIISIEKNENINPTCVIIKEISKFKNRNNEEINDKFIKIIQSVERSQFYLKDADISYLIKNFNFKV